MTRPTDPIALLTCQGCTPWYADQEWAIGLLDEVAWLSELAREDRWPVVNYDHRWGHDMWLGIN